MKHDYIQWFEQWVEKNPPQEINSSESTAFTDSVMHRIRAEKRTRNIIRIPKVPGLVGLAAAALVAVLLVLRIGVPSAPQEAVTENEESLEIFIKSASPETLLSVLEQLGEPVAVEEAYTQEQLEQLLRWLNKKDGLS